MKLHDADVRSLCEASRPIDLARGDVLVHEGDDAHEVFYVRSGHLDAVTSSGGTEVVLGRVAAGDLIGEIAVVTGRRRMASLRAATDASVLAIPRPLFEAWMERRPDLADAMAAAARERIDRAQVATMIEGLLGAADPTGVQDILDVVEWRRAEAGEVVLVEGDPSDAVYFVVSGRVVATQRHPDGSEVTIQEMGGGETIGELGLIDHAPRAASVRAIRDTTLARFSTASFESLVHRHPGLALHVARSVVRRAGRVPTRSRASAIAVVVTAPVNRDELVGRFVAQIARFGSTFHLSSARVDAMLNEAGLSQRPADDVGVPRLSEFVHQADVENDYVVYEADRDVLSGWTRRCLRHADRVVVVVSAAPGADEQRHVRLVTDELRRMGGTSWSLALVHPGGAPLPSGSERRMRELDVTELVHVRDGCAPDVERLARLAIGRGVGLVLSGGGARGFAHIGVARALHELGVTVDRVGGASIGAPIGAGIAMTLHPTDLQATIARQFHRLLDYTLPMVAVLKGARIARSIDESVGGIDIEDLWLGYYCVSTNLSASRLEVHDRGELALAVRASVAIPGVLPPVPFRGDLLVDGGVLSNLPVQTMRTHPGIGTVLAVNVASEVAMPAPAGLGRSVSGWQALRAVVSRRREQYPSLGGVLLRTMVVGSLRDRPREDGERGDLFLDIDCPGVNMLAFDRVDPVAQMGYEAARPAIERWLSTREPTHPTTKAV